MDFVDKNIEKYVEALSDKESPLLKEINEYTINHVHQPRMLSGHLQGRILSFISKIKHPKNILEIGTYTGYSALCLAEGLAKGGKLIGGQKNIDVAAPFGKITGEDFAKLRSKKTKKKVLKPFQVNKKLMKKANSNAIFMHCLPVGRGEEVTDEVIDGKQSVVWRQALNRVHAQKSIIKWCLD